MRRVRRQTPPPLRCGPALPQVVLPSIVWMVPSGLTASTRPTWEIRLTPSFGKSKNTTAPGRGAVPHWWCVRNQSANAGVYAAFGMSPEACAWRKTHQTNLAHQAWPSPPYAAP